MNHPHVVLLALAVSSTVPQPSGWSALERDYYDSAYRLGKSDGTAGLKPAFSRYADRYDPRYEGYLRKGYEDGFDGRAREYSGLERVSDPTIYCASKEFKRESCAADAGGGVVLVAQLGDAPCVRGISWGHDAKSVWVDKGCRAHFDLGRHGSGPGAIPKAAAREVVSCAAEPKADRSCAADTRGGVRLLEQTSTASCEFGKTWEYTQAGIRTRQGCAGRFEVGRPSWSWTGKISPGSLTCSSSDGRYQYCYLGRHIDWARLGRPLTEAPCVQDKTWGFDSRGVWVTAGCQGQFTFK